jgi:hypothetical protein
MVRVEVGRRGVAARGSVEHSTQPYAIHDAAVNAEAHDATRELVHHHEHPVCAQDGRIASKQIEAPQTVLRVPEDCEPRRPPTRLASAGTACRECVAPHPCSSECQRPGRSVARSVGNPMSDSAVSCRRRPPRRPGWVPWGPASSAPWTRTAGDIAASSTLDGASREWRVSGQLRTGPAGSGASIAHRCRRRCDHWRGAWEHVSGTD